MEKLSVNLIQSSLIWENKEANIRHFDSLLATCPVADLIVLPEMFTTGFTMNPAKHAESVKGPGLQWMQRKSIEKNCVLTGSICVEDNQQYFNRLYWVEPNQTSFYNKRHLFRMGEENQHYTAGTYRIYPEIKKWKILPLVCYDLRFPVWSRNHWQAAETHITADYDVLMYCANWPEVRNYPWKQLLIARAIENQCYVIGVNRTGTDGNGLYHCGDSMVIDPLGKIISHTKSHEEGIETILLDYALLSELRKKFPVGLDADPFEFNL